MHTTPFDFDVITGPSVPRDDRKPEPQQGEADQPPAAESSAQPPAR